MPGIRCAISGCKNAYKTTRENSGTDIKYYTFPKDSKLCAIWVEKCDRNVPIKTSSTRICSIHFEKNAFERDLMAELMNVPDRMKLTKSAVPTLELPRDKTTSESPITIKITQNPYVKLDKIYSQKTKALTYKNELQNKQKEYNKKVRKSQPKPTLNSLNKPKNILKQSSVEAQTNLTEALKTDLAKNVTFDLEKNIVHQLEHSDESILQALLTKRKKKRKQDDSNANDSVVADGPIKRRKLCAEIEISKEMIYEHSPNINTETQLADESVLKMEYENIEYLDTEFNDENYFDKFQSKEAPNNSADTSITKLENFVYINTQNWENGEEAQVAEDPIEIVQNQETEVDFQTEEIVEENLQNQLIEEPIESNAENHEDEDSAEEIEIVQSFLETQLIEEPEQAEENSQIVDDEKNGTSSEETLEHSRKKCHNEEVLENSKENKESRKPIRPTKKNSKSVLLKTLKNDIKVAQNLPNIAKIAPKISDQNKGQNLLNIANKAPTVGEENTGQIAQNPNPPAYVLYYVLPTNNVSNAPLLTVKPKETIENKYNFQNVVPNITNTVTNNEKTANTLPDAQKIAPVVKNPKKTIVNNKNLVKSNLNTRNKVKKAVEKFKVVKKPEKKLGEKQLQCLANFRRLNYKDKIERLKKSKIVLDETPERVKPFPKINLTPIANLTAKKSDVAEPPKMVNHAEYINQNKIIMALMEKNRVLRSENETYKEQITTVTKNYKALRAEHRKAKQTVSYLQNIRPSKLAVKKAVVDTLKDVFTENQIKLLTNKQKKVVWTKEEEVQALTIKNLSKRTYLYLKNQLGYPLPGLSTVQRWELRRDRERRNSGTVVAENRGSEIVDTEILNSEILDTEYLDTEIEITPSE